MASWKFQVTVTQDMDGFHAHCEDLDLESLGNTIEAAVADPKDAIEFYLEMAPPEEIERLRKKMYRRRFEL